MDLAWIWKSAFLVFAGMVLLRIAGRKSISQMSVATTVIMISIGTTIVQPIANNQLWKAIGSAAMFIVTLLLIEILQLKFDWFEKLMSGKSVVVIENGQINQNNLHAIRMTVDQLEIRLRQQGIANISDVKIATLEPNGQIGYELMRHAKPVTVGDLERLLDKKSGTETGQGPLFQEVSQNRHPNPIDPKLQ
ncbi:DUF421 domain-containing protein [Paenibacillus dendritiformis]|uniref:YetF C-terminal domain-containing protein n=1 Tax=Paenibacillus dendritiformis C454 TaxID=1131935 RepID=H3S9J1_9BACL|nr:DUF421 domain-containing protein [Paenibacillus dendritiformis]EHQ64261.1 hypothetical protein PDENDC454_00055 [Paenibacillus dendritiformis C454]CAH8770526.1 DUF421 domain-containing protein [Paenibacillus dendritiformis]